MTTTKQDIAEAKQDAADKRAEANQDAADAKLDAAESKPTDENLVRSASVGYPDANEKQKAADALAVRAKTNEANGVALNIIEDANRKAVALVNGVQPSSDSRWVYNPGHADESQRLVLVNADTTLDAEQKRVEERLAQARAHASTLVASFGKSDASTADEVQRHKVELEAKNLIETAQRSADNSIEVAKLHSDVEVESAKVAAENKGRVDARAGRFGIRSDSTLSSGARLNADGTYPNNMVNPRPEPVGGTNPNVVKT